MKDLSILNNVKIAHRGIHNEKIPENSIPAFKEAIKLNIPIELDIHLLKDKTIVVFHDDNLKRMTGIDKQIKDCTYEEIKNLKLNNTKYEIPLLNDILKLVNGKVLLDIEYKFDNKFGKLEKESVKYLDNYNGNFIVKSFNPKSVFWFRLHRPNYIRGLLVCNYKKQKINILKRILLNTKLLYKIISPDFIAYEKKIDIKNNIKPFLIYTIKHKNELRNYKNVSIIAENIFEKEK